jgi:molybdopterin converting factor small subunit
MEESLDDQNMSRRVERPVIEVRVTFVGLIQRLVGSREEVITLPPETTLGRLLEVLVTRFGRGLEERLLENGDLADHATVLINGSNALTQGGLTAKLSNGSPSHVEIVVLGPPLMGG